jgi:hypothetical protein
MQDASGMSSKRKTQSNLKKNQDRSLRKFQILCLRVYAMIKPWSNYAKGISMFIFKESNKYILNSIIVSFFF